jgi:hypothetical protein
LLSCMEVHSLSGLQSTHFSDTAKYSPYFKATETLWL